MWKSALAVAGRPGYLRQGSSDNWLCWRSSEMRYWDMHSGVKDSTLEWMQNAVPHVLHVVQNCKLTILLKNRIDKFLYMKKRNTVRCCQILDMFVKYRRFHTFKICKFLDLLCNWSLIWSQINLDIWPITKNTSHQPFITQTTRVTRCEWGVTLLLKDPYYSWLFVCLSVLIQILTTVGRIPNTTVYTEYFHSNPRG